MNKHAQETLDAYYAEAASWNRDRVQSMRSSHRLAWIVAGVGAAIALLEAIALVFLMPLKTIEPYTLMVDRTTGYVQALRPLDQARITPDTALTQSFLVQYVIARETFDMATLKANYRKVALFSADAARSSYLQTMQVNNLESPLVRYPRATIVDVRVKSVSPIGSNSVLVRFETVRTDANGQAQRANPWVAVVRYRYSSAPMSVDDRFVNPLGFQVTSYRKDPEVLPAAGDESVSTAASASPTQPPIAPYYNGVPASPPQVRAR